MGQTPNDWKSVLGQLQGENPYVPEEQPEELKNETSAQFQPGKELVWIFTDSKKRKGKTVTVVQGIQADEEVLQTLAQQLKTRCGTGGSVKDGEIILQGDVKSKVQQMLSEKGFKTKIRG
jgi:translation initiation factor 1